jgi:hypothetical protein
MAGRIELPHFGVRDAGQVAEEAREPYVVPGAVPEPGRHLSGHGQQLNVTVPSEAFYANSDEATAGPPR